MTIPTPLTKRYQNILRATIQHYIATAEPVGSKTLVQEYNFSVSSATIRNALGQLEKAGLLYQPHPSAGRIPSDGGYRIYVDNLITPDDRIGQKIEQHLSQKLAKESFSFETLIHRATQILANFSGYIALITLPQTSANQLRHVQLIPASAKQVILIIVTDSYQTESILMDLPQSVLNEDGQNEELLAQELQLISNFLNTHLKGKNLSDLMALNWQKVDQEFVQYTEFLKLLLFQLQEHLKSSISTPIMIHGLSEVLRQPEFSQLQQVQMLLHLLEEQQDQLLPLIFDLPRNQSLTKGVTIRIGSENPLEPMRPCSLISAVYQQRDIPVGSVGVIGPTRMVYENIIPLVESTADYLSEALS
ncbi:heat-inducible transcription repressor HrcA [Rippkaea orientalis PCC 8801]|uniref:Heat-inducible transcription repressor HrcA n=1 Tax=Rippkaea orientalis (strain PCC 8801 / RF-1) TaxID=41431 RepID=B7JZL0_RIPO1|nr:heat-inducible transcriptional repressor HrcA [Rippkaea orientalis]ACK64953.1 heat-inducible transcription repressor HrcA [Rippkaea orientalis PCC 8801]